MKRKEEVEEVEEVSSMLRKVHRERHLLKREHQEFMRQKINREIRHSVQCEGLEGVIKEYQGLTHLPRDLWVDIVREQTRHRFTSKESLLELDIVRKQTTSVNGF